METAAEVGDDHTLRDAVRHVMFLVGMRQGRLEEALGMGAVARAIYLEAGMNPDREPSLLSDVGLLAAAAGRTKEASQHFTAALQVLQERDAPSAQRFTIVNNYAAVLMQQGDWDAARLVLQQADALARETYGPSHPSVADAQLNLGQTEMNAGDLAASNRAFEAALEIFEAEPTEHAARLALTWAVYAAVAIAEGRPQAARTRGLRAQGHVDAVAESDGILSASLLDTLGRAAVMEGRDADALRYHEQAAERARDLFGPSSPNSAVAHTHYAEALLVAQQVERARPMLAQSRKLFMDTFGADSEYMAELLVTEALVDLADGQAEAALDKLDEALQRLPESLRIVRAQAHFRRARACAALGDGECAAAAAAEARATFLAAELSVWADRVADWQLAQGD